MKMCLEGEKKKLPAGEEKKKKRSRDEGKKKRGGGGKPRRKWWEEKEKKRRSDWGENTKQNWPGDGERKRRGSGERPANHSLLPELCTPLMVKLQSKTSIYFGKKKTVCGVFEKAFTITIIDKMRSWMQQTFFQTFFTSVIFTRELWMSLRKTFNKSFTSITLNGKIRFISVTNDFLSSSGSCPLEKVILSALDGK